MKSPCVALRPPIRRKRRPKKKRHMNQESTKESRAESGQPTTRMSVRKTLRKMGTRAKGLREKRGKPVTEESGKEEGVSYSVL